jgi:hypothetical protein
LDFGLGKLLCSSLKTCNRALFLVTYNSGETDRQKVNILLEGVVEQIELIGGLSKNMWFIFNRIDVFHGDKDRVASENQFIDRTRSEIDKLLTKHHLQIEPSQVAKISTMPALLSLLMRTKDDDKRIEAASKLDRNFNFLIPDDLANELPRNSAKWSSNDCDRVASAIWNISYGEEFDRLLSDNIQKNLAELIFLPIIQEFEQEFCTKITDWADNKKSGSDISHVGVLLRRQTFHERLRNAKGKASAQAEATPTPTAQVASPQENRIKLASINYVKSHSVRLLDRLDWAIKVSLKFGRIPKCFKELAFWCSILVNRLFSKKGSIV